MATSDTLILIVEDDEITCKTLKSIFEAEGYDVIEAHNGDEMHQLLSQQQADLIVLDINLPGKNGLILARELREYYKLGLIFITCRDNEVDKILGLEIGADDYLTKPFNPRELTIRARNLLHRTKQQKSISSTQSISSDLIESYHFNGWELDVNSRSLISPTGITHKLPRSEYRALIHFIENSGKILSREVLLEKMTGRILKEKERTVDVTIRRLRRYFEDEDCSSEIITTIHGEGYRFCGELELS